MKFHPRIKPPFNAISEYLLAINCFSSLRVKENLTDYQDQAHSLNLGLLNDILFKYTCSNSVRYRKKSTSSKINRPMQQQNRTINQLRKCYRFLIFKIIANK